MLINMVYFVHVSQLLDFDTWYHLILNTFSNSTIQSQVNTYTNCSRVYDPKRNA